MTAAIGKITESEVQFRKIIACGADLPEGGGVPRFFAKQNEQIQLAAKRVGDPSPLFFTNNYVARHGRYD